MCVYTGACACTSMCMYVCVRARAHVCVYVCVLFSFQYLHELLPLAVRHVLYFFDENTHPTTTATPSKQARVGS